MCGIIGSLVFKNSDFMVTESYLIRMRDTMTHRGPDSSGLWIADDRKMGLGHRRLAIIDLSDTASQPMSNENGSIWVSFNGEIYNHTAIRAELEKIGGHSWKTDHSDTEVIIHAFEEWGIDCLQKFRGMFAIAIWDTKNRELWLVRDRIGIKPLYYAIHHGRITFASEIKAMLQDPEFKPAVHEEAFYHFLSFLTTPAPQTLFDGVKKLPGGTWLKVTETGEIYEHRYWELWDHTVSLTGVSEDEIAEQLLGELRTAVKIRKMSDVPVGVFLSGGIDSSTNAALFSEGEGGPVKSFTIGYKGEYESYRNELDYARQMARAVNADHHELLLTVDDLLDFLPKMVYLQDEPIADPVCVPVYYVSKLARDNGVIVCQVGEGSDELFLGYPWWNTYLKLQRYGDLPVPSLFKKIGLAGLNVLGKKQHFYYEMLRRSAAGLPVFWGGAEAFSEVQKQQLLSPHLQKKFKNFSSWEALQPIHQRFIEKAQDKSWPNWMSYVDLNYRLPELLLMRVDKMSMGVSLEGRVPFLDHKFVELAMSIPASLKLKNNCHKYILKKAVCGLVPDEIIDRPKQGFGVPIYEWLFGRLGDKTKEVMINFCNRTDFFDRDQVLNLVDQNPGPQVWYLLNFALWWERYIG